jgi:uridine kinase
MPNWFTVLHGVAKGGGKEDFLPEELLGSFQSFLGKSHVESLIIAYTCMCYKRRESKSLGQLFEKLSEKITYEELEESFINLIASGLIQINSEDHHDSGYSVAFTHRVEVALRVGNDTIFKSKNKKCNGEDRIMLRMYAHAVLFKSKITDLEAWVGTSSFYLQYFDIEILKQIRRAKLDRISKAVVLYICVMHAVEGSSTEWRFLSQLFSENRIEARRLLNSWKSVNWRPIQSELLEIRQYPIGPPVVVPAERIQRKIYGISGNHLKLQENLPPALQRIPVNRINCRKLFFNPTELAQIDILRGLLKPTIFNKYRRLMESSGKYPGISVLLSGGPGTGKTELARQVAKISGRDLLMFNVAEQRDKYFGESEKRIKEVFDCYRELSYNNSRAPILFFNEADSVFQARVSSGSSISNTENTVQTILLNELERFEGILICTTNRPDSFDDAFTRRFDLRIVIHPPTAPVRLQLLRKICKKASINRLTTLAEQYTFTAAELENFLKFYHMHSLINKPTPGEDITSALARYLNTSTKQLKTPVGFKI